jgi:hypothetical protein
MRSEKGHPLAKYHIAINFESDYELETHQLQDLFDNIVLQIQEPQTWKGENEDYTTTNITIELGGN